MSKVIAIDFGLKRTGIAVSDELRLIASPLTTVATDDLVQFLENIIKTEKIETAVVGLPKKLNNTEGDIEPEIQIFIQNISQKLPDLKIVRIDERFTSKMAFQSLLQSGVKKKKRQEKSQIDAISAAIILQSYLYQ